MNPATAPEHEDRKTHRRRMLKAGKILTGVQRAIIECVIRDMSESGAKLRVGEGSFVPAEFVLYVPVDQACYRVQTRHREGMDVGVEILETVPKPGWLHF